MDASRRRWSMTASSTGWGGSDAPALLRCVTFRQPGVSARARSTSSGKASSSSGRDVGPFAMLCVITVVEGAAVEVTTIVVPDPGPGEALVEVKACGVCHSDLHYREGAIAPDFPFLLGHEAAGVVEAVGAGVGGLEPGDSVVLAWRAPCGRCRSCARGRPWYCFDSRNAAQKMTLEDGTELSAAIGIGALSEACLVDAEIGRA